MFLVNILKNQVGHPVIEMIDPQTTFRRKPHVQKQPTMYAIAQCLSLIKMTAQSYRTVHAVVPAAYTKCCEEQDHCECRNRASRDCSSRWRGVPPQMNDGHLYKKKFLQWTKNVCIVASMDRCLLSSAFVFEIVANKTTNNHCMSAGENPWWLPFIWQPHGGCHSYGSHMAAIHVAAKQNEKKKLLFESNKRLRNWTN